MRRMVVPHEIALSPSVSSHADTHDDVERIRTQLEKLVSDEAINKEKALEIIKLHNQMETVVLQTRQVFEREIDGLKHTIQRTLLQSELNVLSVRHQTFEAELKKLRAQNEELVKEKTMQVPTKKR